MAEKDIAFLNSLPDDSEGGSSKEDKTEKKPRALWSPEEETLLITAVLDREEVLFGDFQGTGSKSGVERKREGWEEVAGVMNAQFSNWKRTAEVCRKKYNNSKQRAKGKIDDLKREKRKTGGGEVAVELSQADEIFMDRQDGRPGLFGLESGFDSDETPKSVSNEVETEEPKQTNKGCLKGVKRDKGSKRSLTEENLQEDTKRIKLQQRKLELEIIKLEKEIKMIDAKTAYYESRTKNEC